MIFRSVLAAAFLAGAATSTQAQTGEINLLTELGTPFPPGCLSIDLPEQPRSQDSLLVDNDVLMPAANSDSLNETVRVQVWRVACADDEFSVVLVRLTHLSDGAPVLVPLVFADSGNVEVPLHPAQLLKIPAAGNVGATGNIITETGTTWMLAVDPYSDEDLAAPEPIASFLPAEYNEVFTLELFWGAFSSAGSTGITFVLDRFDPALDLPQFDEPVLNGRYSGQWVLEGAPRQGLVLQIAEQIDENFVFAIFFTYLDGEPIWVVGNSTPKLTQPGSVSIPMTTLENGKFISDPNQPPANQVLVNSAGSIEIEVIDCNRLRVNYDFSPLGKGTGTMELDRLVRIAGYDCNPWK